MERESAGRAEISTMGGPWLTSRGPARAHGLACGSFLASSLPKSTSFGERFFFYEMEQKEMEDGGERNAAGEMEESDGAEKKEKHAQKEMKEIEGFGCLFHFGAFVFCFWFFFSLFVI